jgi:outer membrane protein OmpA-like peptidoglycan-associated protein
MRLPAEKLLTCFILFLTLSVAARTNPNPSLIEAKENSLYTTHLEETEVVTILSFTNPSAFVQAAKRNNIPQRKFKGIKGLKDGYYIIAGVYGEIKNVNKAISGLRKKGFEANYIPVAKNGLNYVYLNFHENWQDAITSCTTKFNGKFLDTVWILNAKGESRLNTAQPSKTNPAKAVIKALSTVQPKESAKIKQKTFLETAKQHNIATRKLSNPKGLKRGYYIISGVYGDKNNARKMTHNLKKKGFESDYITNPENNLNYAYVEYHKNWENTIVPIKSKFNGSFKSKVWILHVENVGPKITSTSVGKASEVQTTTPKENSKQKNNVGKTDYSLFLDIAKQNDIATRKLSNLKGIKSGYYIVSGVYSDKNNALRMVRGLKKKGLDPDYFTNPENNLNYTYLQHQENWENVMRLVKTGFDGTYKNKVWILHIEDDSFNNKVAVKNLFPKVFSNNFKANANGQPKTAKEPQSKSKLLEKADSYFDKMWYAEAAELYEKVLKKGRENHTFEIIQKAGDSHYFNTNMEKAYHWYNILYDQYKDKMSADNIFKYAHSLKGTGKYARSKRLMRLYNRKMKSPGASRTSNFKANETIMDELLSSQRNFDIFNLKINSKYSEFSPMFHNENEVVFTSANDTSIFNTRKYKWNDQPYLDLYVAKINEETQELRDAIKFSKKVNTKYHEASVTFSPDNKSMYFTRNNFGKKLKRDKKGVNHLKIYKSKKINGEWTEATEVSFNSDDYSTGHPALSPDGKLLYFVSDMPGSIGQTDIFVVDVLGNGSFSEPRNLGPSVNTERKEMFPFVNNKKLYFSSNGHIGLGGLDVFEVAIDEEDGFLEVKNVGQPVNSNKDDFSYIVDEETQRGFFASNRRGGKGDDDIYSFKKLIVEEVPENLNAIAGVVTELVTRDIMPKALVTLLDKNNIKLKEMVVEDDGTFLFEDLEGDTKYTVKITQSDYFDEEIQVSTVDNEKVNIEIAMRRLKEMIAVEDGIRKLKTEMIYFNFDKFYIRKDASQELDKLVQVMTEYPNMVIKIESHTDSRGPKVYNKYLSDRRAKSTRDYIITKGIDPRRIQSAIGYGEERLINECNGTVRCAESKHLLNRRSEFIIVDM